MFPLPGTRFYTMGTTRNKRSFPSTPTLNPKSPVSSPGPRRGAVQLKEQRPCRRSQGFTDSRTGKILHLHCHGASCSEFLGMSSCGSWVGAWGGSGLLSLSLQEQLELGCARALLQERGIPGKVRTQNSSKPPHAGTPAAPSQLLLPSCPLLSSSPCPGGHQVWLKDGTELLHPCQVLPGDRTLSGEEQLQVFSRKTRGNVCCPLVAPLGGGQHQLLLPLALQSSGNALVIPGQGGFQGCGVGPAGTSQLGAMAVLCHSQWMGCGPGAQCCPHPSPEQTLGILSQSQSAMDH